MKITLITTSSLGQTLRLLLAENGDRNQPLLNPSWNPERNIEVQEFFRSPVKRSVDRGNQIINLSFDTTYQMTSPVKAEVEAMDLIARTPGTADVEIECYSSGERHLRLLKNATIKLANPHADGIRVFVGYQIQASEITIP